MFNKVIQLLRCENLTAFVLLNKQLIQPLPEMVMTSIPSPLTLEYPAGLRTQLAWTQQALTIPPPLQIASTQILKIQPPCIEMALSPPNMIQLFPVQLSQEHQTSIFPRSGLANLAATEIAS